MAVDTTARYVCNMYPGLVNRQFARQNSAEIVVLLFYRLRNLWNYDLGSDYTKQQSLDPPGTMANGRLSIMYKTRPHWPTFK